MALELISLENKKAMLSSEGRSNCVGHPVSSIAVADSIKNPP
jgi:hypothetical protein